MMHHRMCLMCGKRDGTWMFCFGFCFNMEVCGVNVTSTINKWLNVTRFRMLLKPVAPTIDSKRRWLKNHVNFSGKRWCPNLKVCVINNVKLLWFFFYVMLNSSQWNDNGKWALSGWNQSGTTFMGVSTSVCIPSPLEPTVLKKATVKTETPRMTGHVLPLIGLV